MNHPLKTAQKPFEPRAGQLVEVRSAAEILATLDENGELDSLPFMPEMLQYCGKRLTVYKVAHKLCDTQAQPSTGMRRMNDAVHLTGARCDGSAHGGCEAACLMYWKTAWLRPIAAGEPATAPSPRPEAPDGKRLLPLLTKAARRPPAEDGTEVYRCQATELLRAAPEPLPFRYLGQFARDVGTGNFGVWWTLRTIFVALYNLFQGATGRFLPSWLRIRGGRRWGSLRGTATRTPTGRTDLQPGDLVRVKPRDEIEPTLNADLLNRGMGFDPEMARFCGRTARVTRRIDRIVDERTGRMLHMRHPCIVLENVVCEGAYNINCPRAITPYWREVWLDKIDVRESIQPCGGPGERWAPRGGESSGVTTATDVPKAFDQWARRLVGGDEHG
jgi:hypothetical protein